MTPLIVLIKTRPQKAPRSKCYKNFKKTQFFRDSLKYLGYVVDSQGLRKNPKEVEAITKYPVPTWKKEYLAGFFNEVLKRLWHAHAKNSDQYNRKRKPAEFEVNDIVWKKTYYQIDKDQYFSKKLAPKFVKCRITYLYTFCLTWLARISVLGILKI